MFTETVKALESIIENARVIKDNVDPAEYDMTTERQIREVAERLEAIRFTLL